jgi:hypothetical protein
MTYTGRLTLLSSTINYLPMYAMCSTMVSVTLFIHFEKSGMQLLWADNYNKKHGKFLAKWDIVCNPKDQQGLGVLNLRTQITRLYKTYISRSEWDRVFSCLTVVPGLS